MEEVQLYVGMKVGDSYGQQWRLVSLFAHIYRFIMLNTDKRVMIEIPDHEFYKKLSANDYVILNEAHNSITNLDTLTDTQLKEFHRKKAFVNDIRDIYGPSYADFCYRTEKPAFTELYTKYGFAKNTATRIVTRWLQEGFSDASLLNRAKTNRREKYTYVKRDGVFNISQETISNFDYVLSAYKRNRVLTLEDAYVLLVRQFYSSEKDGEIIPYPESERPSKRQFIYYLKNRMDHSAIEKKKTSLKEFYNDKRVLSGKSIKNDAAVRPGYILEADAMEMDFNIVSSFNKEINIGRPVLYMLTDIYSHAIVAFHVGLDNNSNMALTSLMMNLLDDREEVLRAHNIKMDLSLWPKSFVPHEIRCDRGSDFVSRHFEEVCRNLGILRTLEPGATGSLKGLIERSFGLFNTAVIPHLFHTGLIQKRYDSKHKKEACLTYNDAYTVAAMFVAYRNGYDILNRKLTKDMVRRNIRKSPISIWNYGVSIEGLPEAVTSINRLEKMFLLLPSDRATIARDGIKYRGLTYINRSDETLVSAMYLSQTRTKQKDSEGNLKNSMAIRYDPRSINNLYYESKGSLQVLSIVTGRNIGIADMTWDEYEDYLNAEKIINKEGRERILKLNIQKQEILSSIVNIAITKTYADDKNIPKNRDVERNEINFNNRIQSRFPVEDETDKEKYDLPNDIKTENEDITTDTVINSMMKMLNKPKKEDGNKENENKDLGLLGDSCPEDLWI